MRIAIDLHIHTALSPCADPDMTPNNIVNMAMLKGLDAIAITDHNSCDNVEAVIKAAENRLIVVPGMEVQTREDVHLLCYFSELDKLLAFDEQVRFNLPNILNNSDIFGQQLVMNEKDEVVGERSEMLISSIDMSIEQVVAEVRRNSGVAVPAHVDRSSYSIISQLGFIPPELGFRMLEISRNADYTALGHLKMPCYHSSDAHALGDILERECFFTVKELSTTGIISYLRGRDIC